MISKITPTFRTTCIFTFIALAMLSLIVISMCAGSVNFTPFELLKILFSTENTNLLHRQIILDFRAPQVLTALLAGASLGTAGLLMQTVFRNPLADPFVLGVNSGASLGVAVVLLITGPTGSYFTGGLAGLGHMLLILASSGGALTTLFIVLLLSRKVDNMSVLIIGLMISYAVSALVSILMFFSMAERLQAFISWSFGDYGSVNWHQMYYFAPAILGGIVISTIFIKPLDSLLMGEQYAESIGTKTRRVRFLVLLGASLLAGTVTGFCGPIGFLGIAAPHICRYLFQTSKHIVLIPASILVGALLSLCSDLLARGPWLDVILPLNSVTALIGAPVVILVLINHRRINKF